MTKKLLPSNWSTSSRLRELEREVARLHRELRRREEES